MPSKTDWAAAMRPLLEKYKDKRHPLEFRNTYQLIVMVVLSAQSTDDIVNKIAPPFFDIYPNMEALSGAKPEALYPLISKVRNFGHKAGWLVGIARQLGNDAHIPQSMEELTALPGIGRKSASVILRESGRPPEGIIVDIHVVRVAPRLGIAKDDDPKKIEEQMMKQLPRDEWDAGMAMSFLGREICRPQPECERCLMNTVCAYYARSKKAGKGSPGKSSAGKDVKGSKEKESKGSPGKAVKASTGKAGKISPGKAVKSSQGKAVKTSPKKAAKKTRSGGK